MRTFKDEDGREYEVVAIPKAPSNEFVIRPIKPQPKWSVSWLTDDGLVNLGVAVEFDCSNRDRAQLIKTAIESVMEEIMTGDKPAVYWDKTNQAIYDARQAIKDGE